MILFRLFLKIIFHPKKTALLFSEMESAVSKYQAMQITSGDEFWKALFDVKNSAINFVRGEK